MDNNDNNRRQRKDTANLGGLRPSLVDTLDEGDNTARSISNAETEIREVHANTDFQGDSADTLIKEVHSDTPVQGGSTETIIREVHADKPVDEGSTETQIRDFFSDTPGGDAIAETLIKEVHSDTPVQGGSAETLIKEVHADKDISGTTTNTLTQVPREEPDTLTGSPGTEIRDVHTDLDVQEASTGKEPVPIDQIEQLLTKQQPSRSRFKTLIILFLMAFLATTAVTYSFRYMQDPSSAVSTLETTPISEIETSAFDSTDTITETDITIKSEAPVRAVTNTTTQTSTFNVVERAQNTPLKVDNPSFSFVTSPRIAEGGTYTSLEDATKLKVKKSNVGSLGLRPVTKSEGRYTAKNGVEWQGGWELNNPQANIKRGEGYLNYLKKSFNRNMDDALVTHERGPAKQIIQNQISVKTEGIPVLKYGK